MTILDVTSSSFIDDLTIEESNQWMDHNIGKFINYDEGEGWKLIWEPKLRRWLMIIEDASKAVFFSLMWL